MSHDTPTPHATKRTSPKAKAGTITTSIVFDAKLFEKIEAAAEQHDEGNVSRFIRRVMRANFGLTQ